MLTFSKFHEKTPNIFLQRGGYACKLSLTYGRSFKWRKSLCNGLELIKWLGVFEVRISRGDFPGESWFGGNFSGGFFSRTWVTARNRNFIIKLFIMLFLRNWEVALSPSLAHYLFSSVHLFTRSKWMDWICTALWGLFWSSVWFCHFARKQKWFE